MVLKEVYQVGDSSTNREKNEACYVLMTYSYNLFACVRPTIEIIMMTIPEVTKLNRLIVFDHAFYSDHRKLFKLPFWAL